MTTTQTAGQILDRGFLEIRHRILDVAAALDRIERGGSSEAVENDPRMIQLNDAIRLLVDGKPDRAERAQMVFSDAYDANWRTDQSP